MPAIMPLPVVGSTGTPLRLDVSMCSPEMMDWPAVELPLGAPDLICSVSVPPTANSGTSEAYARPHCRRLMLALICSVCISPYLREAVRSLVRHLLGHSYQLGKVVLTLLKGRGLDSMRHDAVEGLEGGHGKI